MKKFNMNEFLWFLILTGFSIYIYYLIFTGKISLLVHTKMLKYMYFSFAAFTGLALYQMTKIFTIRSRLKIKPSYGLFFITLLIGFTIAPKGLNESIVERKGVAFVGTNKVLTSELPKAAVNTMNTGENAVLFNNQGSLAWISHIEKDKDYFLGKKIKASGFIYRDKNTVKDEFILSRMVMNCCAADSQVIGLLSRWSGADKLQQMEWVEIEGSISAVKRSDSASNKSETIPVVLVEKVIKQERPANPYLYP